MWVGGAAAVGATLARPRHLEAQQRDAMRLPPPPASPLPQAVPRPCSPRPACVLLWQRAACGASAAGRARCGGDAPAAVSVSSRSTPCTAFSSIPLHCNSYLSMPCPCPAPSSSASNCQCLPACKLLACTPLCNLPVPLLLQAPGVGRPDARQPEAVAHSATQFARGAALTVCLLAVAAAVANAADRLALCSGEYCGRCIGGSKLGAPSHSSAPLLRPPGADSRRTLVSTCARLLRTVRDSKGRSRAGLYGSGAAGHMKLRVPCAQHQARPPQVMLRSSALAALRAAAASSRSPPGALAAAVAAAASRGGSSGASGSDAPFSKQAVPPLQPPPRRSQQEGQGPAQRAQRSGTVPPQQQREQQPQQRRARSDDANRGGSPVAPYTQRSGFSTAAAASGLEEGVVQGAKVVRAEGPLMGAGRVVMLG